MADASCPQQGECTFCRCKHVQTCEICRTNSPWPPWLPWPPPSVQCTSRLQHKAGKGDGLLRRSVRVSGHVQSLGQTVEKIPSNSPQQDKYRSMQWLKRFDFATSLSVFCRIPMFQCLFCQLIEQMIEIVRAR